MGGAAGRPDFTLTSAWIGLIIYIAGSFLENRESCRPGMERIAPGLIYILAGERLGPRVFIEVCDERG